MQNINKMTKQYKLLNLLYNKLYRKVKKRKILNKNQNLKNLKMQKKKIKIKKVSSNRLLRKVQIK